ncbi:MAG: FMN-binding protein [bacterium]|nr:FMN-binding protein [bacterium]
MRKLILLPLVLAVICGVAAGALTWVESVTGGAIEARAVEARQAALRVVLPDATTFVDRSDDPALAEDPNVLEVNQGERDGQPVGLVFLVSTTGYGGSVQVLVGVDAAGSLSALKVMSAAGETAGLGTRITEPWFQEQFAGKSGSLQFGPGLDSLTGATISARAVLNAANIALKAFPLLWGR